jgi:alpha-L-fucosidase
VPAECDVSIRPGWFHHQAEDDKVKTLEQLVTIYYGSVGRNGLLLLNVPPDRRGLIHDNDCQRLVDFRKVLDKTFEVNLALGSSVVASNIRKQWSVYSPSNLVDSNPETFWTTDDNIVNASLELDLGKKKIFNVILLQEYIKMGQRVKSFDIGVWKDNQWEIVAQGTTIGYKRLLRIESVNSQKIKLTVRDATDCPILCNIGLYLAPQVKENTILEESSDTNL